ncbi:MAG: ATP synthase F1 subunit epsilon [Bacteroidota bacterium]|jgi:F-type H+-transporting ATPase subunit epsilon
MDLEIVTPDTTIYSGTASLVQLPGVDGLFEILNMHAPLISVLKKGRIKIIDLQNETHFFDIKGGVVEVVKNKLLILAE